MISLSVSFLPILFVSISACLADGVSVHNNNVRVRKNNENSHSRDRRVAGVFSNDSDEEVRQRVALSSFNITLLPSLLLENENDVANIHVKVENVITNYIGNKIFQSDVVFEKVLLARRDEGTLYQKREINDGDSTIQFRSGAAIFQASDSSQLPSTNTLDVWVKEAVEEGLLDSLQATTQYASIDEVVFQSDAVTTTIESPPENPPIADGVEQGSGEKDLEGPDRSRVVVGVVLGSVAAAVAVAFAVFARRRKKKSTSRDIDETGPRISEVQPEEEDFESVGDASLDQGEKSGTNPNDGTKRSRTVNLFADFFQPLLALVYRSFNFLSSLNASSRKTDMITR